MVPDITVPRGLSELRFGSPSLVCTTLATRQAASSAKGLEGLYVIEAEIHMHKQVIEAVAKGLHKRSLIPQSTREVRPYTEQELL